MTDLLLPPSPRLRDEIDEQLLCVGVVQETHDVRSFVLRSPSSASYAFLPGQHLTVTVDVDGTPTSRCYSISSSPARPDELVLTVKRVAAGPVSGVMHDHVAVGDLLTVTGPLGAFSTHHFPATRHLLLSAGSGITPVMSMLRDLCESGEPDVVFVHHARTPVDLVFRRDLEALAAEHPGLRVVLVCEDDAAGERWEGHRGRLTADLLAEVAPDLADREVFLCGPAPYMAVARDLLESMGADPARVHHESFDLAPIAPLAVVETSTTTSIELRRSSRTITCPAGTPILTAAALAGVTLPSSCAEGVCGTCKTTLLSGEVDMEHQGGIRPREIADGKILLCCSVPRGDVVLDA